MALGRRAFGLRGALAGRRSGVAVGLVVAAFALYGLTVWAVTRLVRGQDILVLLTAQLAGMVCAFFMILALGGATAC